jgi:hypothetical protein
MNESSQQPPSAGDNVIVHSLTSRNDLNGKAGRVKSLIPESGCCAVAFSAGDTVSIRPANLWVEQIYDDMLTIDGRHYCATHRFEICAECGYNFRMSNRLTDLEWDPHSPSSAAVYAKAEALDLQEASENMPSRRAPGTAPGPSEAPLRTSQLAPANLDPASLKPWDHDGTWPIMQAPFLLTFSQTELGLNRQGQKNRDVETSLRETLLVIAEACDDCCADRAQLAKLEAQKRKNNPRWTDQGSFKRPDDARHPIPSFVVQDKAQSEAVMLHVVRVLDSDRGFDGQAFPPLNFPVIVVRFLYQTAASMSPEVVQSMKAGMRLMPRGTLSKPIGASVAEVRLLVKMLLANRARLAQSFLLHASKELPPGWQVSVLMPLIKKEAEEKQLCPCGQPAKQFCGRCKKQGYCSKDCQKAHWPAHKTECRKPDVAKGSIATVSLAAAEQDAKSDEGMARMMGLNLHGQALHKSMGESRTSYSNFADDEGMQGCMVPFKLQIPMAPTDINAAGSNAQEYHRAHAHPKLAQMMPNLPPANFDPRGIAIMAYDQRRRLQFKIYPSACPEHAQLVDAVRTRGVNGLKAYFNAYVTPERELKIVMSEILPPQPW